ncbi:hypothetical protein LV507_08205 [Xanthomonas translucens]|uniref:hypothetical protein n=1 Tax=Xanthomonas campestris pv. translucens TaxID=343 RepID=UPI001F3E6EED|nr:hypothetical protein [Xanthomonas translucens]UII65643.1 hypothetical protein LV507_08205 [Xanthomonas translucens]
MPNHFSFTLLSSLALSAVSFAAAACCPGDGNTAPAKAAGRGLGQSQLATASVSSDAAWSVYEFERDGIRYVQIDDKRGNVRAAIGHVDGTFWVLPIGSDADRVSVPGSTTAIPVYTSARWVYGTATFEVWVHQTASGEFWVVRRTGSR